MFQHVKIYENFGRKEARSQPSLGQAGSAPAKRTAGKLRCEGEWKFGEDGGDGQAAGGGERYCDIFLILLSFLLTRGHCGCISVEDR